MEGGRTGGRAEGQKGRTHTTAQRFSLILTDSATIIDFERPCNDSQDDVSLNQLPQMMIDYSTKRKHEPMLSCAKICWLLLTHLHNPHEQINAVRGSARPLDGRKRYAAEKMPRRHKQSM